ASADPFHPRELEIGKAIEAVESLRRCSPVVRPHAFADVLHILLLSALLDEEAGERVALRIQRQDVPWVILHLEQIGEGNPAVGGEKLDEEFVLLALFAFVLDSGAGALVGPARQRAAEVRRENRVRNFVRQHAVKNALARALNVHGPLARCSALKDEAGSAARAETRSNIGFDRTRP